jgi:drug/metabolite transporter (DMT)-like permease
MSPPAASTAPAATDRPSAPALAAGFGAVYVIWGSTYLAIRFALESLPPFLMAGVRFVVAGAVLYAWTRRARGVAPPTRTEWWGTAVVGGLLLLGGNGAVVWAEQFIPSGLAALLVATVPLWMVVLDWAGGGERPGPGVVLGLTVGLAGVGLLVDTPGVEINDTMELLGAGAVVLGALSWAVGSLHSRRASLPASPRLATAMQMLTGGGLLLVAGVLAGEPARFDPGAVTFRSAAALLYLVVAGSLVAFSAYIWLLRHASPARVSTYAYVNPVVALFLGWALAGEPLTPRTLLAAAVILGSVALITVRGGARRRSGGDPGE